MDTVLQKSKDIYTNYNLVFEYSHNLSSVFTNDSQYFYISNNSIYKISTQTLAIELKIDTKYKKINFLSLSPNGTYLSAISSNSECSIFETVHHSVIFSLPANRSGITSLTFLSNPNIVLIAQIEFVIHIYDISTHSLLKIIEYPDVITKVLVSNDDKVFIVGAYLLKISDISTDQENNLNCLRELFQLSKAPDDSIFLAGDEFGGIWEYIPENNYFGELSEIKHGNWVSVIAISANSKIAASGGLCIYILVWDLAS